MEGALPCYGERLVWLFAQAGMNWRAGNARERCLLSEWFQGKVQVSLQISGGLISAILSRTQDLRSLVFLSALCMCVSCSEKGSDLLAASPFFLFYYLYRAAGIVKGGSLPKLTLHCPVYNSMKYAQEEAFKSHISAFILKGHASF